MIVFEPLRTIKQPRQLSKICEHIDDWDLFFHEGNNDTVNNFHMSIN